MAQSRDDTGLSHVRNRLVADSYEQCIKGMIGAGVPLEVTEQYASLSEELGIANGELDRKLRHSSALRRRLVNLLDALNDQLNRQHLTSTELRSISTDFDYDASATGALQRLKALSFALKSATPSNDISRLSDAVVTDAWTAFDIERIQSRYPHCQEKLQRRLGVMNRLRRIRLQEAEEEWVRKLHRAARRDLAQRQQADGTVLLDDDVRPFQEILADYDASRLSDTSSDISSLSSGFKSMISVMPTHGEGSAVPRAAIPMSELRKLPPLPREIRNKTDLQCPFCKALLAPGIQEDDWHNHVAEDLEPYICTFGGCTQSYRTFGVLEDWQKHEKTKHRLLREWTCYDCDRSWADASGCREHMMTVHSGEFMPDQLDRIVRLCKQVRPMTEARSKCLFCGLRLEGHVQVEFEHIAAHLIDIAVFVLPVSIEDETTSVSVAATELQLSDGASDVFRPPEKIEGLGWFEKFSEESIVPFDIIRTQRIDSFTVTRAGVCKVGPQSGQLYAIQTWRKTGIQRQIDLERMSREVEVLRRLSHVHVISVVGCYSTLNEVNVILRPLCNMSLSDVLNDRQDGPSPPHVLAKWFGCLAVGLDYLHSNMVRHGDVKPGSILVWNDHVCYSGFEVLQDLRGRDADWESAAENRNLAYTLRYAAAEVQDQRRARGRLSDIFSLGCVFLEMLTVLGGKGPHDLNSFTEFRTYAQKIHRLPSRLDRLELPAHLLVIKELCLRMMQKAPEDRPTASELVRTILDADSKNPRDSPPLVGKCIHAGESDVDSNTDNPRDGLSLVDRRMHSRREEKEEEEDEEEVGWTDDDE